MCSSGRLTRRRDARAHELGDRLRVELEHFSVAQPALEDVYLSLTSAARRKIMMIGWRCSRDLGETRQPTQPRRRA